MELIKSNVFSDIKKYNKILLVFFSSIIVYLLAAVYNDVFVKIISVTSFLAWHNLFEFASILVSFSIFMVTYFIYDEYENLKMMTLGCAFLTMGFLDIFHTLSYKGMADFFIVNDTANRATVLWILARLFGSLGLVSAVFIPPKATSKVPKEVFASLTTLFCVGLFIIVTYYPNFLPVMFIEGEGLTKTKIFLEYIVISIFLVTFIKVFIDYRKVNNAREYMYMISLVLLIFSEFAFTNYGSVYDAFNYIGHLFKVIAYIIFYKTIYIENITAPYVKLKQTKNKLKKYSDNLDILVEKRTGELNELNKILLNDIEHAKEVQHCLLPAEMPKDISVDFDVKFFIAERLSGDFYNVVKLDENNVAVYIGDVSGHGVSAAMLTVFANQNVIQLKEREHASGEIISPGLILKTIYNSFNKTNINSEKYILMLYGIYNIKSKSFTYSSAGINVPPYVVKKSGEVFELDVRGLPICKLGGLIDPTYDNKSIELETGDKILFYSDGLVEAKNEQNKEYGQDKLVNFLKKNYKLNASELNCAIKNDFFNYINTEGLMDDTTLLVMELTK